MILKLSLGARATSWPIDPTDPELSLAPLVEPIRPLDTGSSRPYPNNIYGETFHTAMGAQLGAINQAIAGTDLTSVHSVVGQGDSSITVIQKNGTGNAFAASLFEATAFARLVAAAGARYEVGAVVLTHGERDAERATYEDDIARLASDYDQDLRAITGQTRAIPLIVSQQHPDPVIGRSTSTIAAWKAGLDYPGKIYCAGPKYQYGYAGDRIHLVAGQYDRLGIKYAEVVLRGGRARRRLAAVAADRRHPRRADAERPLSCSVSAAGVGRGVRAPHQVIHAAWKNGRGFEVEDGQGEVTISEVTIDGDTVRLAIDRLPVAPLVVRYAMTQDATQRAGGQVGGRFGQLHDSDPLIGVDAEEIDCGVTAGAVAITPIAAGGFARRTSSDIVEAVAGSGLAPTTLVYSIGPGVVNCRSRGPAKPGPRACASARISGTTPSRSSCPRHSVQVRPHRA